MRLKDILSFSRKSGNVYGSADFMRVITSDGEKSARTIRTGTGRVSVTLAPMRTLSIEGFEFPFSNASKIRDALRLQVMPYTAAGEVDIFPVILKRSGRISSGIVWYASPDELEMPQSHYARAGTHRTWPAPMPFVSRLQDFGGNGVTMWTDESNVCSILWQSNSPVLYRWRRLTDEKSAEKELAWYDVYCQGRELERGGNFIVNAYGNDEAEDEFAEIVSESVEICPWMSDVNLSRKALQGERDLERTVRVLTRVSCWLLALGALALSGMLIRWYSLQGEIQSVRTRNEAFYRETFDPERTGRISNPVLLARDKIASMTGTGHDAHPMSEVLADMGEVFTELDSARISLDIVRYNADGIDCTGVAPDMTTVLNFRRAWETRAEHVQVDNTQFVSGIGYRFDLRVRW